jgi:hypothetical protein
MLGLMILFRSRKEGLGQIRVRCASLAVEHSEHHDRFHFPNALQTRLAESFFDRGDKAWLLTERFALFARNDNKMATSRVKHPDV